MRIRSRKRYEVQAPTFSSALDAPYPTAAWKLAFRLGIGLALGALAWDVFRGVSLSRPWELPYLVLALAILAVVVWTLARIDRRLAEKKPAAENKPFLVASAVAFATTAVLAAWLLPLPAADAGARTLVLPAAPFAIVALYSGLLVLECPRFEKSLPRFWLEFFLALVGIAAGLCFIVGTLYMTSKGRVNRFPGLG
jgi:hypothetical protein